MRSDSKKRQQSFTALVQPHLERMYRLAYRLTAHREDAQDLVQDVLLKLYPQSDRLAEVNAIGPWISRIVYNLFIDKQRQYASRRLRIVSHPELSADPDRAQALQASTEALVEGEFTINRLQTALAQLSDDHRVIINLHDVEGYTLTEVAEITGVSLGTLKSRRQRARERLQKLLDEGPDHEAITSKQDRGGNNHELRPISGKLGSIPR